MKLLTSVLFSAALLLAGSAPLAAADVDPIEEVRELYLLATEREPAVEQGLDAVAALRGESALEPSDVLLLDAYEGALITLKAKYVFWPTTRMRHLNEGLAVLDRLVAGNPGNSEIRYLRLMSCYHLPSLLGRGGTVREDFGALAQTLPADRNNVPEELYRGIVDFVVENGRVTPEESAALTASLR
jgi:hypothetical protein